MAAVHLEHMLWAQKKKKKKNSPIIHIIECISWIIKYLLLFMHGVTMKTKCLVIWKLSFCHFFQTAVHVYIINVITNDS